jgi:hypothetical protein
MITAVWIGCDVLLSSLPISLGETWTAFPPEPTRICARAGSAGQCRPVGRLEEVALTGAEIGARESAP